MASVLLVRGSGAKWPTFSPLLGKVINRLGLVPKMITRPLGLAYLASCLKKVGHTCDILDLQTCSASKKLHALKKRVRQNHYEFIGFTFFTYGYPEALRMARMCKEESPHSRIAFGGPHASFTSEDILKHNSVDFVIIGEGERSLPELVSNTDYRSIKGLAYRQGDTIFLNQPGLIEELNSLPLPDRERCIPIRFPYSPIEYIQTSRGCPKRCSFCVESRLFKMMRFRDPKGIVEEMKALVKSGKKLLYLCDSNFSASKTHVESLCREIRKKNLKVSLFAEMSVEFTDEEMLRDMAHSCFKGVAFGIESLSTQSLAGIAKTLNGDGHKKKCLDLLSYGKKVGLTCSSYYIVPLHHQNKNSVREEIKLLQSYGQVELMFLTPFPGTPLWEESNGHLLSQDFSKFDSYHVVYNPSEIAQRDLKAIYRDVVKQNRNLYADSPIG